MYIDAIPERALLTRVIEQAIFDAQNGSRDAYEFLTTDRIDPFAQLLGIDPTVFKTRIVNIIKEKSYA